jgi:hypothetical protein
MIIWTLIQKIINSKIFLYCVIGILIWFWINDRINLRKDINRFESNQKALIEQHSREIQITSKTFERLFHKEDSIAKLVGIKPTILQQTIVNNYSHKDSTVVNIPFKDTTNIDTIKFIAPIKCFKIGGYVTKSGITFNYEEYNDKLYTFLYKVNNKRVSFRSKDKIGFDKSFLFIKWNNHIDSKTYSECKQDTVSIEKNIKIIKE